MCTLAWGTRGNSLWACFNRDEQRTRPIAEPPEIVPVGPRKAVYARDPSAGGTWFAASNAGWAIALLNHYPRHTDVSSTGRKSRGGVVLELLAAADPEQAETVLNRLALPDFAPFTVFILAPARAAQFSWDGLRLSASPTCPNFWTTSSYCPEEVAHWRRERWRQLQQQGPNDLGHASSVLKERGQNPAYGFTMDREDARTVSRIELKIDKQLLHFGYYPRQAAGLGFEPPVLIETRVD